MQKEVVKQQVLAIRSEMPRLGARKLHHLLKEQHQPTSIGRDRLFSLLRNEGLLVTKRRRFTKTTNSRHWMRKYPNTIKDMVPERPNQLWVADITYIPLNGDFSYLHLITDAYSKLIVGHHLSPNMASSSTQKALEMAIERRSCKIGTPLIHHSDRGLQYCSGPYTSVLKENGIEISMTEDSSPYDNAIAERVNGILKDEFILDEGFSNFKEANKAVNQSIRIYNEKRPHMSNHLLTPKQMHEQSTLKPKSWRKKNTSTFKSSCVFLPSPPIS